MREKACVSKECKCGRSGDSSSSTKSRVAGGRSYNGDTLFLIFNSAPVEHGTQENPKLEYKEKKKGRASIVLETSHTWGENVRFILVSDTAV